MEKIRHYKFVPTNQDLITVLKVIEPMKEIICLLGTSIIYNPISSPPSLFIQILKRRVTVPDSETGFVAVVVVVV